jgi:TolB-like protein/Tfp pilus assembly protein PilF/tRNA A-37 threonylcarbamoyl transferase component Bud32
MTPERWKQLEAVFFPALDLPDDERSAFLERACAGDAELLKEAEALLAEHHSLEGFLEKPLVDLRRSKAPATEPTAELLVGRRIGPYRLVAEIGRGGMGAVFEAMRDDGEFRHRVAIKLVQSEMSTDFVLRRFRNERQILAALDHPNIARLLDGGTTVDGRPYFVMEYIDGEPLTVYADARRLSLTERMGLFRQVCSAVAYAHRQLVIHRDLKPSNILVTPSGTAKLLDFGIAKLLNPELAHGEQLMTSLSLHLMTPEYASPEQVQGLEVTPASDQYSLGVLLYELLTGHRPYTLRNRTPFEIARCICEEEPETPSRMIMREEEMTAGRRITPELVSRNRNATLQELRAELERGPDAIVLKTLRKEPAERYQSIAELSADIERFLGGQPVQAVSPPARRPATPSGRRDVQTLSRSIAVLPFKVLSREEAVGQEHLFMGIGLADAVITRLSSVRSLMVRPTSAVLKYGADADDLLAIGRELNADFVLDGRILRGGGELLRVSVQLISVRDEATLWAAQFDERLTDIFAVQDSVSALVARALAAYLTEEEREHLARRGTNDPRAYEAYLRGRVRWHEYTEEGLTEAIKCFKLAIELDPDFAAPYTGIADYYTWLGITSLLPPAEAFKPAQDAATKAIELDDKLAEAYASLAFVTWAYDWDVEASERLFQRAFELNNNYAQAHEWYAHLCASQGRHDESIAEMRLALKIDPHSAQLHAMLAYVHHYARRHADGVRYIERSLELDPDNYIALQGVGWMYPPLGRAREAVPYCQRAVEVSGREPLNIWTLALVLVDAGQLEEARALLDELHEMAGRRYVSPYYFALLYTALGEFDDAFKWLSEVIARREYWAQWIAVEPRLDALRSDARFGALLERFAVEKRSVEAIKQLEKATASTVETISHEKKTAAGAAASNAHLAGADAKSARVMSAGTANSGAGVLAALSSPKRGRGRVAVIAAAVSVSLILAFAAFYYFFFARSAAAEIKSIAVLPFVNTSGDADSEWLSDGITESIIDDLSRLPRLRVKARTSVFRYKGREVDPRIIGRELDVETILMGRITQHGDTVMIDAELVDAHTGDHIWGAQYNRKAQDIARMQQEIARDVSRNLRVKLTGEDEKILSKDYTTNSEAYQLYLQGRFYWNKRSPEGLKKSIELYTEALSKDPSYALAYAGLANSYYGITTFNLLPNHEGEMKVKAAAQKAVELDDHLAEAHTALGLAKVFADWDWQGAEAEFRRAIELNPGSADAHYLYGEMLLKTVGRMGEAIREVERARELDPLSIPIITNLGRDYVYAHQPEKGMELLYKALEMEPSFGRAQIGMWEAYVEKGMYDEALKLALAQREAIGTVFISYSYAKAGQRAKALQIMEDLKKDYKQTEFSETLLAIPYVGLGDKEEAFRLLEEAYRQHDWQLIFIQIHPAFAPLRSDPRYADLIRRMNLTP